MYENTHQPWYNTKELQKVYKLIYDKDSTLEDKQVGLDYLQAWKARCPESAPFGIESTFNLLKVHLDDANKSYVTSNPIIQYAYAQVITQFVNQALDSETVKGASLYTAAKTLGLPEWIIDLRHNAAHGNCVPSLKMCREASRIGLDWLQKNYWEKLNQTISNYFIGQQYFNNTELMKLDKLMTLYINLSFCVHADIKNLADILNSEMKESILNDADVLFGDKISSSNLKTVSVSSFIKMMDLHSKKFLKNKEIISEAIKRHLGPESIFLSLDLAHNFNEKQVNRKYKLNSSYVLCFEVFLTFLHSNDLILDFILELIKISQTSADSKICLLAALWISEILNALRKSKLFLERVTLSNMWELKERKGKELKELFYHWYPNERARSLILNLFKPPPITLSQLQFVQPIVQIYNPYLYYYIRDLLKLLEPKLSDNLFDHIVTLTKIVALPETFEDVPNGKIYSIDDLVHNDNNKKNLDSDASCQVINDESYMEIMDNEAVGSNVNDTVDNMENGLNGICKPKVGDWLKYPVGTSLWQEKDNMYNI